jgi:hypothetical protein
MTQASVIVAPTIATNVTMPFVGLTFDRGLKLLVCSILCLHVSFHRLRGIVCVLAFILGIRAFQWRLCLIKVSQSSGKQSL